MPRDCTLCGSTENVEEHHVSYEPEETVDVCRACHRRIHGSSDYGAHLEPDDRPEETTIRIPEELADVLYARKGRGESYSDVLWRLLDDGGNV